MPFADIEAKTTITGFSDADKALILAAIKTAYDGSATAKTMFDNWIATPANTIKIDYVAGQFAETGGGIGKVLVDLAYLTNASYVGNNGTAVQDTLVTELIHELVHAIKNKDDNWNNANEYRGDTVKESNIIYKELGLPEQNSYIAYDSTGTILTKGVAYTNGAAIDRSVSWRDWNSSAAGDSKDLLIGSSSANTLQSGDGNDFLVGAGGNDDLKGGAGTDTAVLFGKPTDYDIRLNADGTWTSKHVRGAKNEGNDTFTNLEKVQFEGAKTFDLAKNGLTFQTDFAIVVDQTGSMGDDIAAVKSSINAIINALFADDTIDARVGIVGFRDNTNGEPTQVFLKFTDHDNFADRKAAVVAAANSLGASGGGDLPETAFDGLLKALNGDMGDWRPGAGIKRIAMFTDAVAKDAHLLPTVLAFAKNIGGSAAAASSEALGTFGSVDRFEITFDEAHGRDPSSEGDVIPPFVPTAEAVVPPGGSATIEIYTIFIDNLTTPDPVFEEVSDESGGKLLTAADPAKLVETLLDVIETGGGGGPGFRMFAASGFAGAVGGSGGVFGTNDFQDIALFNLPGEVSFDPSFNRGGDIIRLPGNASAYKIQRVGSTAVLDDGNSSYAVPLGTAGALIVFGDGVRKLLFDTATGNPKLGNQIISSSLATITAPTDGSALPGGANPAAKARIFLEPGAKLTAGGDEDVFGTAGTEAITYTSGDLSLDPSFNRGGDTLFLPGTPDDYRAYVFGSAVVLLCDEGTIKIPVGTAGMTLDFGGETMVLKFDTALGKVKIGELVITANSTATAISLGGGDAISLDVGGGSTVVTITLGAGEFLLRDDAEEDTNVRLVGFDEDDHIEVTGADSGDYNFSSGDADADGAADDLLITFNSGSTANLIAIIGVITTPGIIFNEASAEAKVGHDFISFG